jgi:hypothetical protein
VPGLDFQPVLDDKSKGDRHCPADCPLPRLYYYIRFPRRQQRLPDQHDQHDVHGDQQPAPSRQPADRQPGAGRDLSIQQHEQWRRIRLPDVAARLSAPVNNNQQQQQPVLYNTFTNPPAYSATANN